MILQLTCNQVQAKNLLSILKTQVVVGSCVIVLKMFFMRPIGYGLNVFTQTEATAIRVHNLSRYQNS